MLGLMTEHREGEMTALGNPALARAVSTPCVEATGPEFERRSTQDFHRVL